MKALIDGRLYDTEKATMICSVGQGNLKETIYRTAKGNWFIYLPKTENDPEEIKSKTGDEIFELLSDHYGRDDIRKVIEELFPGRIEEA